MRRCATCLYPLTSRPFISFDEEGVCPACKISVERKTIDWSERKQKLLKLIEPYRKDKGYDCVIGVSGGKDSMFQVHYAVKELGLRPLVVTFNHLDNSEVGLRNLENLVNKLKVDHVRFTPNPDVVRRCCSHATRTMLDPFWHEHSGIYTFPVQMAVNWNVPLLLWGEYGYADLLGMFGNDDYIEMSKKLRQEHGMRGQEAEDFIKGTDLTVRDLEFTVYPTNDEIEKLGLRGIYIGNYIEWDHIKHTKLMIDLYDFKTDKKERTFNIYENVECYFNDSVHDQFKYWKYGYGRATDHASMLIRKGYITRSEGAWLVNLWDPKVCWEKLDEFLDYINMTREEMWGLVEKFKDPRAEFKPIEGAVRPKKLPYISNPYIHDCTNRRRLI